MIRSWVLVGSLGLQMLGLVGRPAASSAQEVFGAAPVIDECGTITPRQEEWLKATPEQRVGLSAGGRCRRSGFPVWHRQAGKPDLHCDLMASHFFSERVVGRGQLPLRPVGFCLKMVLQWP